MPDNWLKKIQTFSFLIGEGTFELCISLIIMIIVERSLGETGLGVFAYLFSILVLAGFLSEAGISRYLEKEIALNQESKAQRKPIEKALYTILATSILCTVFFLLTAVWDTSHTRVEEKAVAYFIIGITIPLRNLNRIRIAILQGNGRFTTTAGLKTWKRIFLIGTVAFLLIWNVAPSYLMMGYLISELGLMIISKKAIQLPGFRTIWRRQGNIRSTLAKCFRFVLTDDALDVILYMDFFILGLFVSSSDLGLYAEASILARIFLLIPISIKPVFRKQYCSFVTQKRFEAAAVSLKASTAVLFFLHSVLAVFILLFYSEIMESLYHGQGKNMVSFYIFAELLPGLLFFSSVISQEPAYEAEGKVVFLQKTIVFMALLNLGLNCFCIPFAGFYGAAFATSVSMFVYFLLFGKSLSPIFTIQKVKFIIAGSSVYLIYMFFKMLNLSFSFAFFLVPIFLFTIFFLIDLFNFESRYDESNSDLPLPENRK